MEVIVKNETGRVICEVTPENVLFCWFWGLSDDLLLEVKKIFRSDAISTLYSVNNKLVNMYRNVPNPTEWELLRADLLNLVLYPVKKFDDLKSTKPTVVGAIADMYAAYFIGCGATMEVAKCYYDAGDDITVSKTEFAKYLTLENLSVGKSATDLLSRASFLATFLSNVKNLLNEHTNNGDAIEAALRDYEKYKRGDDSQYGSKFLSVANFNMWERAEDVAISNSSSYDSRIKSNGTNFKTVSGEEYRSYWKLVRYYSQNRHPLIAVSYFIPNLTFCTEVVYARVGGIKDTYTEITRMDDHVETNDMITKALSLVDEMRSFSGTIRYFEPPPDKVENKCVFFGSNLESEYYAMACGTLINQLRRANHKKCKYRMDVDHALFLAKYKEDTRDTQQVIFFEDILVMCAQINIMNPYKLTDHVYDEAKKGSVKIAGTHHLVGLPGIHKFVLDGKTKKVGMSLDVSRMKGILDQGLLKFMSVVSDQYSTAEVVSNYSLLTNKVIDLLLSRHFMNILEEITGSRLTSANHVAYTQSLIDLMLHSLSILEPAGNLIKVVKEIVSLSKTLFAAKVYNKHLAMLDKRVGYTEWNPTSSSAVAPTKLAKVIKNETSMEEDE